MDYNLKKQHIEFEDLIHYDFNNWINRAKQTDRTKELKYAWKEAQTFREENESDWNDSVASDYAALLMLAAKFEMADSVLRPLIKKNPGSYTYNSNYGTLMELMGKDEEALRFIKKSIEIDPESHESSEWIHVKILEAKINLKKNIFWLKNNSVLGIDFGTDSLPIAENGLTEGLIYKLHYQLEERTHFVRPKDEIVSDLMYTMANLMLQNDQGVIVARKGLELALLYGDCRKEIAQKRITYLLNNYPKDLEKGEDGHKKERIQPKKEEKKRNNLFPIYFSPALIVIIVIAARRRRKKRNSINN